MQLSSPKSTRELYLKISIVAIILCLATYIIFAVEGMLFPSLISIVLYYLLEPFVAFGERTFSLSRVLSTVFAFLLIAILGTCLLLFFYPSVETQYQNLVTQYPVIRALFIDRLDLYSSKLIQKFPIFDQYRIHFVASITQFSEKYAEELLFDLPSLISNLLSLLLLVPIFTFFILIDVKKLKMNILSFVPNQLFESSISLIYKINLQLSGFIQAKMIEAVIIGIICAIGYIAIGLQFSVLLAIFAAVVNLIPYVGPLIGIIPPVLVALVLQNENYILIGVLSTYGLAMLIDFIIIIPLFVAKMVNLHPLLVIVFIVTGQSLMGVLGMLLALPIAAIIKVTFIEVYYVLFNRYPGAYF